MGFSKDRPRALVRAVLVSERTQPTPSLGTDREKSDAGSGDGSFQCCILGVQKNWLAAEGKSESGEDVFI